MAVKSLSMATKQITRNIALTPHFDRFVQSSVDSGRYQSASEVVRDALRLLENREQERREAVQRLRHDIELGWQQSERGQMLDGPRVFAEIRKMSKARRRRATGAGANRR
jgi:antitoxin ParD1/3/4